MPQSSRPVTFSDEDLNLEHLIKLRENKDNSYKERIPRAFARLLDPDVPPKYLFEWLEILDNLCIRTREVITDTSVHSDTIIEDLIDAGVIETLLKISSLTRPNATDASSLAPLALTEIFGVYKATVHSRNIFAKIIDNGAVETICKNITEGLFSHRLQGIRYLRGLFLDSPCNGALTVNQVATVISTCCTYHLNGLQWTIDEEKNENTAHNIAMLYPEGDSSERMVELRALFSGGQQDALEGCWAMIQFRTVPISKQFSLQILQHKPDVIKDLLKIACQPRIPEHLQRGTDGFAASILLELTRLPSEVVPGHDISLAHLSEQNRAEWDMAIQCNQILYSCPKALDMLVSMRNKVIDNGIDWDIIQSELNMEERDATCDRLIEDRATVLIASLRIMTNFTYLELPPLFFLAILPIAYMSCSQIQVAEKLSKRKEENEQTFNMVSQSEHPERIAVIASLGSERSLGPLLLFRALSKLSEAGYGLNILQTLKFLPENTPIIPGFPTHLVHLHQIVEPGIMGKLIRMSVDHRIIERKNKGKGYLASDPASGLPPLDWSLGMAIATFASAAELALAVSCFGSHPSNASILVIKKNQRSITKAKQEVVLCLGNAAEIAGRTAQWQMARYFARYAVEFADTISLGDAAAIEWDIKSARKKNSRRLSIALKQKQDSARHGFGLFEVKSSKFSSFIENV